MKRALNWSVWGTGNFPPFKYLSEWGILDLPTILKGIFSSSDGVQTIIINISSIFRFIQQKVNFDPNYSPDKGGGVIIQYCYDVSS